MSRFIQQLSTCRICWKFNRKELVIEHQSDINLLICRHRCCSYIINRDYSYMILVDSLVLELSRNSVHLHQNFLIYHLVLMLFIITIVLFLTWKIHITFTITYLHSQFICHCIINQCHTIRS